MVDVPVPVDDLPTVVIEPAKPNQKRLKQYVVLKGFESGSLKCKEGDMIRLIETDAFPYIAAKNIIPLDVALREKRYPLKPDTIIEKVVTKVTGVTSDSPNSKPVKKSFLGNALRDAIQAKKPDTTPKSKIDQDKLAAIKSGGKK